MITVAVIIRNQYHEHPLSPWKFKFNHSSIELETEDNRHEMEDSGKVELDVVSIGKEKSYELEGRAIRI
jgi:hypothetical protein